MQKRFVNNKNPVTCAQHLQCLRRAVSRPSRIPKKSIQKDVSGRVSEKSSKCQIKAYNTIKVTKNNDPRSFETEIILRALKIMPFGS